MRFMPDKKGEIFDIRIHVREDEEEKIQCSFMNGKTDGAFAHGTKPNKEEIKKYINKVINNLFEI